MTNLPVYGFIICMVLLIKVINCNNACTALDSNRTETSGDSKGDTGEFSSERYQLLQEVCKELKPQLADVDLSNDTRSPPVPDFGTWGSVSIQDLCRSAFLSQRVESKMPMAVWILPTVYFEDDTTEGVTTINVTNIAKIVIKRVNLVPLLKYSVSDKSISTVEKMLSEDLKQASEWLIDNKLSLHLGAHRNLIQYVVQYVYLRLEGNYTLEQLLAGEWSPTTLCSDGLERLLNAVKFASTRKRRVATYPCSRDYLIIQKLNSLRTPPICIDFDIIGMCKTAQTYSPPGRGRSSGNRTASRKAVNVHSTNSDLSVSENTYDAVVWYNQYDPGDEEFVQELIDELEGRRGIRLFVPGRDDYGNTLTAQEIERRCRRAIIVVSRSFLQSTIFDFQQRFAQALSPGPRSELFQITREEGVVVPRMLQGRNTCDLTNTDMVDATWDRLTAAIRARIGPASFLERTSHPNMRPAVDSNHTTPKDVLPSRNVRTAGLSESSASMTSETYQNTRTDLQMLLKKRKTTDSAHTDGDLTPTVMPIETHLEQEDETDLKRLVLSEVQSESTFPEKLEYQHQPTTWMLKDDIERDMPSQNLILAQSGDQTSAQTPPLFEDRTSIVTPHNRLTSELQITCESKLLIQ